MQINLTYDPLSTANNQAAPAALQAALSRVVAFLDSEFKDDVQVNVHVGFGELNGTQIGAGFQAQNSPAQAIIVSYSALRTALINHAGSADDLTSIQFLPSTDPISGTHNWWVNNSQASMLGLGTRTPVAALGFTTPGRTYTDNAGRTAVDEWDYDRTDGITSDYVTGSGASAVYHHVWDFEATALHEITEIMGRTLGAGQDVFTTKATPDGIADYTPEDLFRFSTSTVHQYTGRGGYFSPDAGTPLGYFNPDFNNADPGDWDGRYRDDAFNSPLIRSGIINEMTVEDLRVMDVLGWTVSDDYSDDTQFCGDVAVNGSASGTIDYERDTDWFRVYLNGGTSYRFNGQGSEFGNGTLYQPVLSLYDSSSTHLATDFGSAIGTNYNHDAELFYTPVISGYYYLSASDLGSPSALETPTGTYRVSVTPDDYSASVNGGAVAVGGQVGGNIETSGDHDWFRVQLTAGRPYVFSLRGTAPGSGTLERPQLSIVNGSGNYLHTSYSGTYGDARVTYTPTVSGTYYLDASALINAFTGTYQLDANHGQQRDFSADGTSDVLWRNGASGDTGFWTASSNNTVAWHDLGLASTAYNEVGIADINGDGTSDVIWHNASNGDTGYWAVNKNTSVAWHDLGLGAAAYGVAGTGDFNADGSPDVLWHDASNGDTGYWTVNSNDSIGWRDLGSGNMAYSLVGTGDFNADGTTDVLWRNNANGDTGYWAVTYGIFGAQSVTWQDLGLGNTAYSVAGMGDFNADGTTDVLWRNASSGDTGYWNTSTGHTAWVDLGSGAPGYQITGIGDYNADGVSDVLWQNSTSNAVGFWNVANGQPTWNPLGSGATGWQVQQA